MLLSYHFNKPNESEGVGNVAFNIIKEIKTEWLIFSYPSFLKSFLFYSFLSPFWFALKFLSLKKKPKAIIVHTPEASFDVLFLKPLLKLLGFDYKVIVIVHGLDSSVLKEYLKEVELKRAEFSWKFFLHLKISILRSCLLHKADKIFCVSSFVKKELDKKGLKSVEILYNGISPFFPKTKQKPKTKLNKILFIGNSFWIKGLFYLAKANSLLKKPKRILAVGIDSKQQNYLKKLLSKKEISFISFYKKQKHKNLIKFYKNADLFAMPSLYESFGLVYLEALSFSLPLIASKETGGEEIIIDGKNGYLVPKRNIVFLKRALEKAEKNILFLSKNTRIDEKFYWNNCLKPLKKYLKIKNLL